MAQIAFTGNAGRAPEEKALPSGKTVVEFTVAESNGKDEEPTWYRVAVWSEWLRKRVLEHIDKGVPVTVMGRLKVRKYTNSAGFEKESLDVSADQIVPHRWADSDPAGNDGPITDDDVPF